MTGLATALAAAVTAAPVTHTSTGETIIFWVLAPVAVVAALGMVLSRNAVHGALMLVADFFCLAVFYGAQDAPFLAAVQVIVYAGAIMVLFLFVLMLVGVDSSDSLVETLRGQRVAAVVLGLGFAGVLTGAIGNAVSHTTAVGLSDLDANGGNIQNIAKALFTTYVWPFEITSALLIIAAVGAMVLGHRERLVPKPTQRDLALRRFREGTQISPLPGPGVYARHDSVDSPALLPDGRPAPSSYMPEYAGIGGPAVGTGLVPPPGEDTL